MPKTCSVLKGKPQAAGANEPKKIVRFCPLVKCIYYNKRKKTSGRPLRVVLTKHRKPGSRKAQEAEASKPKKSVRFYPVVEKIYYNRRKKTSDEPKLVEYTGYGPKI